MPLLELYQLAGMVNRQVMVGMLNQESRDSDWDFVGLTLQHCLVKLWLKDLHPSEPLLPCLQHPRALEGLSPAGRWLRLGESLVHQVNRV